MNIDASVVSGILSLLGVIGTVAYTRSQASAKSQRAELRHRRRFDLEKNLYIFDLETELTKRGIHPPVKSAAFTAAEDEDW